MQGHDAKANLSRLSCRRRLSRRQNRLRPSHHQRQQSTDGAEDEAG